MNALANRPDFDLIAAWIQPGETVLDLGCGDGTLIAQLAATRKARCWGVERDPENVLAAIARGVNVLQADIESGLAAFGDNAFDHVVLSRTLQTVRHTETLLREILRIGGEAVVSFPNFAYWKNRQAVLAGHMPVSEDLPYQWFDSPNVRFFTIADFEHLCTAMDISIKERRVLDEAGQLVKEEVNLLGSLAVYRIHRKG